MDHFANRLSSLQSTKFQTLRPSQQHVLEEYRSRYLSAKDVGVELPTGSGKTLIALLIAETWRSSGKPVAILSPNKTLARQIRAEASSLNLEVSYMEGAGDSLSPRDIRRYQRAQQIAVMNYWVYFNQNPRVDPAGLLVMDDAHLAEQCLHSLYSLFIERKAHEALFTQLIAELFQRFPEYVVLENAIAETTQRTPPELLSFIDHLDVADRLIEIIDSSPILSSNLDLRLRWNRLRPRFHAANLYIARDALWFRPYIYPLCNNDHYEHAEQILYMSATIGDPGDLSRRLGVRRIEKIRVPSEFSDQPSGRRLIVMNTTNDTSDIPDQMSQLLYSAIQEHPKSVWLCSSHREAANLRVLFSDWLSERRIDAHPTWLLTPLGDEIDQFRRARNGHLFVAGRYDGMDFSGDECRIIILPTLPRAINLQEEFVASYLRDSGFIRRRASQRVVQALGRCTRSSHDFAVFFFLDQRFATYFSSEINREALPLRIMAEIDLAQDLSLEPVSHTVALIQRFLNGDFRKYDSQIQELREDIPEPPGGGVDDVDTSNDEVIAWQALFFSENYRVAQQYFERCWNATKARNLIEIAGFHGWHRAKALYLESRRGQPHSKEQALRVLREAIQRGGKSAWFNRMLSSINRDLSDEHREQELAEQRFADAMLTYLEDFVERVGTKGNRFQQFTNRIEDQLRASSHNMYAAGMQGLGNILGYHATRPNYSGAPDCIWLSNSGEAQGEMFTFELKIEHYLTKTITQRDVGQAHNQYNRARSEYQSKGYGVRSIIVTHLEDVATDAEAVLGTVRLASTRTVLALLMCVIECMKRYRDMWSVDDVTAQIAASAELRSSLPRTGWLSRAVEKADPWLSTNALLNEWNSLCAEETGVKN